MKSINFESPIQPRPADLTTIMPGLGPKRRRIFQYGARMCAHGALEGPALAAFIQLALVLPGEKGLGTWMGRAYRNIATNPAFWGCSSAVPFCLSPKPKGGHYFLHKPSNADESTPLLLLLHGFGGNLLYFPWVVHNAVPEAILLAPSWQINWSEGTFNDRRDYLEMALAHASDQLEFRPRTIWLLPLSQGGPTAFQLLAESPGKYSGLMGISTLGQPSNICVPVRLLHGDEDEFIPLQGAAETAIGVQSAGGDAAITIVRGASHWLLLSHPQEVKEFLRENLLF